MGPINREKIPLELRGRVQWVCWSLEEREGKSTKVPKNPKTGGNAMANDPETWGTFSQAMKYYGAHKGRGIAGIGYVFSFYDPYAGIDLDKCRNPETGDIKEWALEIIKRFDSYTEISPSGTDVHILIKGKLPTNADHQKNLPDGGKIEVYDSLRYFTVTGNLL